MLLLILASTSILAGNQPSIPLPPKPATTKTTKPTSITTIEGPLSAGDRESAGEFVLDFGKHNGLRLRDVPKEYLKWLKTAVTDKPVCREAVERYTGQMESTRKSSSHDNGPQPNVCLQTHEEINTTQDLVRAGAMANDRNSSSAEEWLSRWGIPSEIRRGFLRDMGLHTLFAWQIDCLETSGLLQGGSAIVSATTSAGKSLIADVCTLRALTRNQASLHEHAHTPEHMSAKVIYVVPFVSLVQQRAAILRTLTARYLHNPHAQHDITHPQGESTQEAAESAAAAVCAGGGGAGGAGGVGASAGACTSIRVSECYAQKGTTLTSAAPGQYLYFCTREASKLSTWRAEIAVRTPGARPTAYAIAFLTCFTGTIVQILTQRNQK